jgi:hypothetical protein
MKTVRGEPIIWRWILLLLVFSVMIWGILEVTVRRPQAPAENGDAPAANAAVSSETLDDDSAGH